MRQLAEIVEGILLVKFLASEADARNRIDAARQGEVGRGWGCGNGIAVGTGNSVIACVPLCMFCGL